MSTNRSLNAILLGAVLVASACSTSDAPTGITIPVPADANATTLASTQAARGTLARQLDSVLAVQKGKVANDRVQASSSLGAALGGVTTLSTNGVLFLACQALPYAADAQIVGPAGGTLKMGPHKLRIPKGALKQATLIIAEAPRGQVTQVDFAPHGLQFARSATLSLSYAHCLPPLQSLVPVLFRNTYVQNGAVLEFLNTNTDRTLTATVSPVDHFSSYMIAY